MKKLLIALMVLLPFTSLAQNTETNDYFTSLLEKTIENKLKEMGCSYEYINDEAMHFKHQGRSFIFATDDEDVNFVRIILPIEWDGSNRRLTLEALNNITKSTKFIKANIMDDDSVWFSIESQIFRMSDLENTFERYLRILHSGYNDYVSEIK